MIQLDWESPKPEEWAKRLNECGRSTAFQSWAWGSASEKIEGTVVRRAYILKNGRPVGLMQVFEQTKLGFFTLGKIVRGPLFHRPVMPEDRIGALTLFTRDYPLRKLRRVSVLPEFPDGLAAQGLMAEAGFHQAMGGYETAWLDLDQGNAAIRAAFRQNFRNQLCRAEEAGLTVTPVEDPRPTLQRYDTHRAQAGFTGPTGAMLGALPDDILLCLEATDADGDVAASVLFVLHGKAATYQVGWTSAVGRKANAHNLLLWQALPHLRDRGIRHLDLGGLDWDKAPGVAHFKAGLGGEPFTLPGTFV